MTKRKFCIEEVRKLARSEGLCHFPEWHIKEIIHMTPKEVFDNSNLTYKELAFYNFEGVQYGRIRTVKENTK